MFFSPRELIDGQMHRYENGDAKAFCELSHACAYFPTYARYARQTYEGLCSPEPTEADAGIVDIADVIRQSQAPFDASTTDMATIVMRRATLLANAPEKELGIRTKRSEVVYALTGPRHLPSSYSPTVLLMVHSSEEGASNASFVSLCAGCLTLPPWRALGHHEAYSWLITTHASGVVVAFSSWSSSVFSGASRLDILQPHLRSTLHGLTR